MSKQAQALRLEWRTPAELDDNPKNWRRHPDAQTRALRDVIGEVGWAGALLYNERTKKLIDGHARKKIAKKGEKVPVLIGSWSEKDEAKILATLDPLAALAQRDDAAWQALLADVETDSAALLAMLEMQFAPPINGEGVDDPVSEWEATDIADDPRACRKITMYFQRAEDVASFMLLLGKSITDKTKTLWWPKPPE